MRLPSNHPIWKLATIVVIGSFCIAFTVITCQTFDGPDAQRLLVAIISAAGYGELRARMGSKDE